MKYHIDLTKERSCVGILFTCRENEAVYVGTSIHREKAELKDHPLAKQYAEECDFHFFFEGDELPKLYTVPKTEIAGYDSRGGLFAGCPDFSLGDEPLYYIDREHHCFLIAENSGKLLEMGRNWREKMTPAETIEVFADRSEAERKYRIWEWKDLQKEGDL